MLSPMLRVIKLSSRTPMSKKQIEKMLRGGIVDFNYVFQHGFLDCQNPVDFPLDKNLFFPSPKGKKYYLNKSEEILRYKVNTAIAVIALVASLLALVLQIIEGP